VASTNKSTPTGPTVYKSLNTERGVDPNGDNATTLSGFRLFEENRANVEWWKDLLEEVLGTPQGEGPMLMYPSTFV